MEEFKVRMAKPEDEDAIFDLCVELCDEGQLFDMDPETVRQAINGCVSGFGGIIGVIEGEDALEGIICLATEILVRKKLVFGGSV